LSIASSSEEKRSTDSRARNKAAKTTSRQSCEDDFPAKLRRRLPGKAAMVAFMRTREDWFQRGYELGFQQNAKIGSPRNAKIGSQQNAKIGSAQKCKDRFTAKMRGSVHR
jgi:hypothetical protein